MAFDQATKNKLLASLASTVQKTVVDGTTVEHASMRDRIAALEYGEKCNAEELPVKSRFRLNYFRPPGMRWGS